MTPILGFMPDAEQTVPGILSDCENLIPSLVGMSGAPVGVAPNGVPALSAECRGGSVIRKLDNTRRILAGTATAIYELVSSAWSDVSRGTAYTGGSESRWSIAQFGDATIMANRADAMQRSTSGAFADISGAPKAEIVFSVGAFVMALNVNDGAEKPDGWHCCAAFDETSWTPSTTTQATRGRLVSTPGALTAGARLGEYAVAYKERSIYLGQYVGAPVVWDWIQVPGGEAGCVGKEAICDIGGAHFIVGNDNFWLFDGTRPTPLGDGVIRQWWVDNSSAQYRYKTICTLDQETNRVWVFFVSKNASSLDSALVYHIQSKMWGRVSIAIEAAITYTSPSATIDGLTSFSATIDGLPNIPFDSQYWAAGGRALSVFNTAHQLQSLTGQSASSSLTSGVVGDDENLSLLQQIRLRYSMAPTSATVTTEHAMNSGTSFAPGVSGVMNDGKFDTLKSSRWHKARIDFVGPVTVTHMAAKFKASGRR